ncbi:hypothetical protein [Novosphingobium soli]|uniref:PilZ domain-containing protein n=1 Tax=Novosphingobium soli TaxID=574956 RepID=A0ABV6D0H8_9SPHN
MIYGECVGPAESARVRIRDLANEGCALETDAPAAVFDADFSLWIGAVGPFAATATHRQAREVSVRFKEPLDARILQHFNT